MPAVNARSGVYPEVDPFGARFSAIHNPERWRMAGTRIAGQCVLEAFKLTKILCEWSYAQTVLCCIYALAQALKLQVVCSMA